jgi:tRNA dimethylallyltransferase
MHGKYLIILAGPTAIGKTPLAIRLAKHLGTEIINADSRQIYREMRIGTAVPSSMQLADARHHLIGHKSIHEPYNAGMFELEALKILELLLTRYDSVIMTGGSGLYINAVCHGIDEFPNVDPLVRRRLHQDLQMNGLNSLRTRLMTLDPDYYKKADLNNPKRILKALEVIEMTGRPYSSFLTGTSKPRGFNIIRICLDIPRDELHERINRRSDAMMAQGLLDEARQLYPYRHLNALNTVGYKELFDYFEDKHTLDEAVEKIKSHTRQYARRQLTWFRKEKEYNWYSPENEVAILTRIHELMEGI